MLATVYTIILKHWQKSLLNIQTLFVVLSDSKIRIVVDRATIPIVNTILIVNEGVHFTCHLYQSIITVPSI